MDEIYFSKKNLKTINISTRSGKERVKILRNAVKNNCGNYLCHLCGKPILLKDLTVDHVIPKSIVGNKNEMKNVKPAHNSCNSRRQDIPIIYWKMYVHTIQNVYGAHHFPMKSNFNKQF